ncbi:MAG: SWIM zinc finger family protein [Chloroflexales bacterium]|nr:SWIM zinc finger family protein [Chloroflexales bacterium]
MPITPGLSETLIRQYASAESFSRDQQYYRMDAVSNPVIRDSPIQAQVEGSSYEPYRVRIGFDEGGLQTMHCTCPYDWGGACKHIIAVLLACLHDPASVQARPPLADTLVELDRDQLQEAGLAAGSIQRQYRRGGRFPH